MNDEEYKKIKSTYRIGKVRFMLWVVLAFICLNNIDTSMWWLMGVIFFGIILLIDMLFIGLGTEYSIRGSGYEDRAKKDGLWKFEDKAEEKKVRRNNKDNNKSDEDEYNEKLHFME